MNPPEKKTHPTSIRLPPDLLADAQAAAEELGVPFAVYVKMTLKAALRTSRASSKRRAA